MLHAAAMLIGLAIVWLLFTQHWTGSSELMIAFAAATATLLFAARFFGISRDFTMAPKFFGLAVKGAPDVVRGALATMRAALAADVTMKPALVRIKTRPSGDHARAALANMISAAPGAVVVTADQDGLLVHVIDEDAVEAARLGRLEAEVVVALDNGGGA